MTLLRFSSGALGKCLTTLGPRRTKFHSLNIYGTKKTFINDNLLIPVSVALFLTVLI